MRVERRAPGFECQDRAVVLADVERNVIAERASRGICAVSVVGGPTICRTNGWSVMAVKESRQPAHGLPSKPKLSMSDEQSTTNANAQAASNNHFHRTSCCGSRALGTAPPAITLATPARDLAPLAKGGNGGEILNL
jgi:hypothetical protein